MQSSIVGIIFLIVMNSLPNRVENFKFYASHNQSKGIEFTWNKEADRWDVKEIEEIQGWCKITDDELILGDRGNVDTLNFGNVLPDYKNIKWKKLKELDVEGGKILVEKKRKRMNITLEDEFSDNPFVVHVEW